MQIAILFDERSTGHRYYAGHTAQEAVLGSGILQASGRLMIVRAGTVLLSQAKPTRRLSLAEEAFFGDSWHLLDAARVREAYQRSVIFTWVVSNVDRSTATALHEALAAEPSYLGTLTVNLALATHRALYRLALPLLMRISGRSCALFFRAFEQDGRDEAMFRHLLTLGFATVEWEDIGARETIFDDFDTPDHFGRLESLREFLTGTLAGGADSADELLLVLEDLSPRLVATFGTAARTFLAAVSDEDRAQVGLSGRRYLEQLADALYTPRNTNVNGRDVTQPKVKNRLWAYIEEQIGGPNATDVARIRALGQEVDRLVERVNSALHATPTRDDVLDMLTGLAVLSVALLALAPVTNRKPYLAYSPRVAELVYAWFNRDTG